MKPEKTTASLLSPKQLAQIKVMLVYDVRKPLMDEIRKLRRELTVKEKVKD